MKTLITTAALTATGAALLTAGALALPADAAGSSSTSVGSSAAACTSADLHASFHGTDAAMSHRYGRLVLRNTSGSACSTGGYGGLSYVGDGDGTQVGAPAQRQSGTTVTTIVLEPGQRVVSAVSAAVADVYPAATCRPVHVDGFRVYVPDSRVSQYVAHATTGCANHHVHLLQHQAFARP